MAATTLFVLLVSTAVGATSASIVAMTTRAIAIFVARGWR
jgi:hypothetical protein